MNCEFCNKEFSNKGNLNYHQKTAKYCLKLREQSQIENFNCEFCNLSFTRKDSLQVHLITCKEKLDVEFKNLMKSYQKEKINLINQVYYLTEKNKEYKEQNKELENRIKDLQNQIKELATIAIEKPNTITTNHNNNNSNNSNNRMIDNRTVNMVPFNLTQEKILDIMKDKFQEQHLLRGQEGLADFFVENILITPEKKFLYKCADPSRNHFIFVDEEGKVQKDINAKHLTHIINEPVKQRTREIYQECSDRYFDNAVYDDENNDGTDTTEDDRLTFIGDKVVEITGLKNNNNKFLNRLKAPIIVNK